MIANLLAPKWKHRNPQVRKQALLALDASRADSQNIFLDVVENDPELFLRRLALRRITAIDAVQALRQSTRNDEIYQEATNRLCVLLSATDNTMGISEVKSRLDKLNEAGVYLYVVKHTSHVELQKHILEKLVDESAIVDVVIQAQNDELRLLALEKLQSSAALKRVVKALKRKDKALVTQAQHRLQQVEDSLNERNKLLTQYNNVGNDFLELLELCKVSGEWLKNEGLLKGLYEQWHGIGVQLDSQDTSDNNNGLIKQIETGFTWFEKELKQCAKEKVWGVTKEESKPLVTDDFQIINDELLELLQKYSKVAAGQLPDVAEISDAAANVKTRWQSKYKELSDEELRDTDVEQLKSTFDSRFAQLESLLEAFPKLTQYQAELSSLIDKARELKSSTKALTKRQLEALKQQFNKLSPPENISLEKQIHEPNHQIITELQQRYESQEQKRRKISSQLKDIVREMREAIDQGRSKQAVQLLHRGKKLIKQLDDDGKAQLSKQGDLAAFNEAELKLGDLQDWRQWSNVPVKEKLITDMHDLAQEIEENKNNPGFDIVNAAEAIKAARNEWKKLAKGEHAGDQELWQRFDAACNQAYEPCQRYFAEQAELRVENLHKRQALCQEIELYFQKVSEQEPDKIDWKAMTKIIHTARHDWGQLGIVNRGDRVKINKRFNHILHALEKLLKTQQRENRESKELLIKRVQVTAKQLLEKGVSLDQAIETVKQAQREWKTIGVAAKESKLWQQFRGECDTVFEVRRSEQESENQQRDQEKQQRNTMIADIESAAQLSGDLLQQARQRVEQIKSEWDQLPRLKKGHPQERRLFQAIQKFEKRLGQETESQLRTEKNHLQHNVHLCYELEKLVFDNLQGEPDSVKLLDSVAAIRERWKPVSAKLRVVDQAVETRFRMAADYADNIVKGSASDVMTQLTTQDEEIASIKELLCIKIEVLADLPSPPESRQRRMEFQVAQLAEKMKQSSDHVKSRDIDEMLSEWHSTGLLQPEKSQLLERRFYSALQSIDKDYQYDL